MAHRCWGLDEIVRAIASILVSDGARASAVSLAGCCRSLEEPALSEVWRSLPDLAPLIKCFPPDAWETDNSRLSFRRAPLPAEWARFQQRYASKVQHLEVASPDVTISSTALHLLQLYSSRSPLLPNLVSLYWVSDETFFPFIFPFLSHFLSSIVIDVPKEASLMFLPILSMLPTLSPDIQEVQVEQLVSSPSMEEACSQLLMECNPSRLRKFNVDSLISASALRHILQLPSLEEFWLVANSFQVPQPLPAIVFPSLQLLDIEFNGGHAWLELLLAIKNPALTSLFVRCPGPDVAPFVEAFQLIAAECGIQERLREFRVRGKDEFEIFPDILSWIFSFKNLTFLEVLSECSIDCQTFHLTDDDIDLLTRSLPLLESLAIGDEPCDIQSQITFKGLYAISRRCTRLTSLQIHFNPAQFSASVYTDSESVGAALGSSGPISPPSHLSSVAMLNVGGIILPDEPNVSYVIALGLLGVFPCLEKVEYRYSDSGWKDVDELIRVCRRMGCFTFGKG